MEKLLRSMTKNFKILLEKVTVLEGKMFRIETEHSTDKENKQ